ncbi:hypothetical protein B9Z55_023666 [Caenorhabditis nigoni]|nr:hypothetical protein B9Z55_023666 [Caenorhabditis nigoni]
MFNIRQSTLTKLIETCDTVLKRLNSEKSKWKLTAACVPEADETAKQALITFSEQWEEIYTYFSQLRDTLKSNPTSEKIREKKARILSALESTEELLDTFIGQLRDSCESIGAAKRTLSGLEKSMEETKKEINELLERLNKLENVPVMMPIRVKQEIKQEVEEDLFVVFENIRQSHASNGQSSASNTGKGPDPSPMADLDHQPIELPARNREDKVHTTHLSYKDFVGQPSKIGSRPWISGFKDGEPVHMDKQKFCQTLEDGTDLFSVPTVPTLVKSMNGLSMKVPLNLGFPSLHEYLQSQEHADVTVIDSFKQKALSKKMKISEVINRFKTPAHERDICINILSNEESGSGTKFDKEFRPPRLVEESLEKRLERVLIRKKDRIEEELEDELITEEREEELTEQKKRIEQQMNTFPKYLKFVIVSMAGSFTNVHIDFSASSVFYHVFKGTKIFYLAQPTEENIKIYKEYETSVKTKKKWIVAAMENQWERLVIKAGMTAIIPSGFIHAVYTPEDSIVVGGNFLMENQIARQFELSRVEEKMWKNNMLDYGSLYKEFNNVMFSYTENILFEKLVNLHEIPVEDIEELKEQTLSMVKNLSKNVLVTWYSEEEQEQIIQKLKQLIPVEWVPVEEIPEEEAPADIPMAPENAENVAVDPEAVPEQDMTRTRLPRACKRTASTTHVPPKRRRR